MTCPFLLPCIAKDHHKNPAQNCRWMDGWNGEKFQKGIAVEKGSIIHQWKPHSWTPTRYTRFLKFESGVAWTFRIAPIQSPPCAISLPRGEVGSLPVQRERSQHTHTPAPLPSYSIPSSYRIHKIEPSIPNIPQSYTTPRITQNQMLSHSLPHATGPTSLHLPLRLGLGLRLPPKKIKNPCKLQPLIPAAIARPYPIPFPSRDQINLTLSLVRGNGNGNSHCAATNMGFHHPRRTAVLCKKE